MIGLLSKVLEMCLRGSLLMERLCHVEEIEIFKEML